MFGTVDKDLLFSQLGENRILIVSDETVWKYYGNRFKGIDFFLVSPGESSKNINTYLNIIGVLEQKGFTRSDCIVALGGGVIGDLAGFAASTYMRGIRFVQVPTTLLAMVDSSIGGKTGINLDQMKNGIGTFYRADAVFWDLSFLDTLPDAEFASGLSEVIKYAIGFIPELYEELKFIDLNRGYNHERLKVIINKCIEIKKRITESDFEDREARMLLNFGHTYGHAIESWYGYRKYTHGEAVAIGMAYKIRNAWQEGRISEEDKDKWLKLIQNLSLPVDLETPEHLCAILDLMQKDKKKNGGKIKVVHLESIGKLQVVEMRYQDLLELHGCNLKMQKNTLYPGQLKGVLSAVPSKSLAHRAIIAASMSGAPSSVGPIDSSEDMLATLNGMSALGATIEKLGDGYYRLHWEGGSKGPVTIDCKESGSTLRFLIPFASLVNQPVVFLGTGRLGERPLGPYYEIFDRQNLKYETHDGKLPLTINGSLKPGSYRLPGNVSSQFITGLLMLLPLLEGDSTIELTTPLESQGYVRMTLDVLAHFGITVKVLSETRYEIQGNQTYKGKDFVVEGDYSQAAFWLSANTLGSEIDLKGLNLNSNQGDKSIIHWLEIFKRRDTNRIIDVSQCPDLLPVLSVVAALTPGRTEFVNGRRVRLKESDRIHAMAVELGQLGADVKETAEGLIVEGQNTLRGGSVYAWNDHRIAMALAVAATRCSSPLMIYGAESVKKSYPDFWDDYTRVGGKVHVEYLG